MLAIYVSYIVHINVVCSFTISLLNVCQEIWIIIIPSAVYFSFLHGITTKRFTPHVLITIQLKATLLVPANIASVLKWDGCEHLKSNALALALQSRSCSTSYSRVPTRSLFSIGPLRSSRTCAQYATCSHKTVWPSRIYAIFIANIVVILYMDICESRTLNNGSKFDF